MQKFQQTQDVEVLRNVGSSGPCWLLAKYIQVVGNRHRVRTTGGDTEEVLSVDDDCIRSV